MNVFHHIYLVNGLMILFVPFFSFSFLYLQGIIVKTPVQWPLNKGFSFSCWLRIESFPRSGAMGLFCFLTETGRGCYAVLAKGKLIYEVKFIWLLKILLYIYICITAINFMEIHEVHSVILQSINQKRQSVSLPVNLLRKKWHLVCLTHSIGRAFSGGSQLRCYVDGVLVSSEKCR